MAFDSSAARGDVRRAPVQVGLALSIVAAILSGSLSALTGLTTLVSVSSAGVQGNGNSGAGNITADGRYVAFFSTSITLAPEDTDAFFDVYVRDLMLGTTTLVSVSSAGTKGFGTSSSPVVTNDGRYVAFQSDARNLIASGTNGWQHIFVRDRTAGTTELVSVSSSGAQASQLSDIGNISADGRYVVFSSYAANLVSGDSNGSPDVFLRDRVLRTTRRLSVSAQGQQANGSSFWPRISANGRFVAFVSVATNLTRDANGTIEDVFVRDLQTGSITLVSVSGTGVQGNSVSTMPALSDDGRYVAFSSFARNLVAQDTNESWDVFVRDLHVGTTERVSVASSGEQGNHDSARPHLSPDARFVSFQSLAANLVPGDTNQQNDVFLRDRVTGVTERASVSSTGEQGNDSSNTSSVSGDGRRVVFHSGATTLVAGDANGARMDVFLRDSGGLTSTTSTSQAGLKAAR